MKSSSSKRIKKTGLQVGEDDSRKDHLESCSCSLSGFIPGKETKLSSRNWQQSWIAMQQELTCRLEAVTLPSWPVFAVQFFFLFFTSDGRIQWQTKWLCFDSVYLPSPSLELSTGGSVCTSDFGSFGVSKSVFFLFLFFETKLQDIRSRRLAEV